MLYHGTIVFEVPYEGKWYRIDALHAKVSLYEETDVPSEVAERAVSSRTANQKPPYLEGRPLQAAVASVSRMAS